MKSILETSDLIVTHDPFKGGWIADSKFAIARLPFSAKRSLSKLKTDTAENFSLSVELLGGKITTPENFIAHQSPRK